jgi:hypothetical protein
MPASQAATYMQLNARIALPSSRNDLIFVKEFLIPVAVPSSHEGEGDEDFQHEEAGEGVSSQRLILRSRPLIQLRFAE